VPNLTGIPALDVAIGLSFIFFLLSLVASTLQEFIANLFSLRAKVLERGLRSMLVDATAPAPEPAGGSNPAEDPRPGPDLLFRVYTHPLIRSLYRVSHVALGRKTLKPEYGSDHALAKAEQALKKAAGSARDAAQEQVDKATAAVGALGVAPSAIEKVRLPSYIAPRSFALALLDTVAPDVKATNEDGTPRLNHDIIRETREAIESLGLPSTVERRLLALLDDARGDVDAFRRNVEAWFDDTMARVSGWYKRRAQLIILAIAALLTVALNANALTVAERLWRDPTLRATLVQQAGAAKLPDDSTATTKQKLEQAVSNVESEARAGVPLGWAQSDASDPRHIKWSDWGWAHLIGGWLLTILAVSLGAPFWFDTLSRLSRLRGTGKPETPLPASGRGQLGERVVTGTPPVNVAVQQMPMLGAAAGGAVTGSGPPSGQ
jgi:hypothetical protein